MEQLKTMKECLTGAVQGQISNLNNANYEELGAAVDMIKDLSEAIYYCTVVESMTKENKEQQTMYYEQRYLPHYDAYDYYTDKGKHSMYYTPREPNVNVPMHDYREGRSPLSRKSYMESKELHHDKSKQMQELDKYIKELGSDITEMIVDATPEEKEMLRTKLNNLVTRI